MALPPEESCFQMAAGLRHNLSYIVDPGFHQGVSHARLSMELIHTIASHFEYIGKEITKIKAELHHKDNMLTAMDAMAHQCGLGCPCCKELLGRIMAARAGFG